jgi:DNA repair exonuclease SbcCD ATPase subunit
MKILSIRIKNFRIHQDLSIEFNDKLTLIGGPNESGKSTIAEALHKALFLKSRGNTEEHRVMKSFIHNGEPEVELKFKAQGAEYTLLKHFGSNGHTLLSSPGSAAVRNEEAEEKLTELLKTNTGLSQNAYKAKWENLWIWQGTAFNDPIGFAGENRTNLISGLQNKGAAIVLQSQTDMEIATFIKNRTDDLFTSAGKDKTNSPQFQAITKMEEKRNLYEMSKSKLNELEKAAIQLQDSIKEQINNDENTTEVKALLRDLSESSNQLLQLRNDEKLLEQKYYEAQTSLQRIEAANHQIQEKKVENERSKETREAIKKEIEGLGQLITENQNRIKGLEENLNNLSESNQTYVKKKDFYQNLKTLSGLDTEIKRLQEEEAELNARLKELNTLAIEFKSLPEVNNEQVAKLEKLANDISNIHSAIQAIATSVEILESDKKLKINNQEKKDKLFTFTDDTLIEFGNEITIKVIPGGGTSLADYKSKLKSNTEQLRNELNNLKLESIEEAKKVAQQRERIQGKIQELQEFIKKAGKEKITSELLNKQGEQESARKMVAKLGEELNLNSKDEENDLVIKLNQLIEIIEENSNEVSKIRSDLNALQPLLQEKSKQLETKKKLETELNQSFKENETIIQHLTKEYGEESIRLEKIKEGKGAFEKINETLTLTKESIVSYNPDKLEADINRLNRSLEGMTTKKEELIAKIAQLKTILFTDGNTDPREDFDQREKQYRTAQQEYDVRRKEADAIKMLNQLFQEEQQNLSNEFTRPLSEKVSGYLGRIFNAGVKVDIEDNAGVFTGLRISRKNIADENELKFDTLSGGAKEQVAAAFRLAMAEVLATNYEDCLPIVFDDAFAYSDPNRIENIQSMLDYAANTGGLQVIVFSCNPSDYKLLGAKEVLLNG